MYKHSSLDNRTGNLRLGTAGFFLNMSQSEQQIQPDVHHGAVHVSEGGLLQQLDTLISSKLTAFEATFSEKQKEMNNAHLAKIEGIASKDSYQFKRKGNEQQYQHSVKVFDKLRDANTALDTQPITPSLLQCAQTKINEGMDIVSHRQKLIKLADSSKHGWKIVEQYEAHQLADDSDDEKRIHKAEARCDKIVKEERQKKGRGQRKFAPYPQRSQVPRGRRAKPLTQRNRGFASLVEFQDTGGRIVRQLKKLPIR